MDSKKVDEIPNNIEEIIGIFKERRAIYGDTWLHIPEVLHTLAGGKPLPNKTAIDRIRCYLFLMVITKIARAVHAWVNEDEIHSDSYRDGACYLMMLESTDTSEDKNG